MTDDPELDRLNANRGSYFLGADRAPDGTIVQRFRPHGKPGAATRFIALSVIEDSDRVAVAVVRDGCRLLVEIDNAKWRNAQPTGGAA